MPLTRISSTCADGVARVVLNRPEVRNAFDPTMIAELTDALRGLSARADVRVLVLDGEGAAFSAGADLAWMKAAGALTELEARADAARLSDLFSSLDATPFPVIAAVRGAALGGGAGLVATADVVVAETGTKFGFTEVRLGIVPAVIAPYAVRAIGPRHARRYFTTGEIFGAERAAEIGLVSEVVGAGLSAGRADEIVKAILNVGPDACRVAKRLVRDVAGRAPADVADHCAATIATTRRTAEAQEGLAAFLEKRPARFAKGGA